MNMRRALITRPVVELNAKTLKFGPKRLLARTPKRGARTRARFIELPRKLWDRIVLLLFIWCLVIFLHAFFGFGDVDQDLRALNDTFIRPPKPLSISPSRHRHLVAASEDKKTHAPSVMVDWHGNYELLPSTASALAPPASIPQDAFPGPTPTLVRAERGRALGERSHSTTTDAERPMDVAFAFYGTPYDPFRLTFEDSVDEGGDHGLYPVTGPPRTARTRRFGRCFPGETCL